MKKRKGVAVLIAILLVGVVAAVSLNMGVSSEEVVAVRQTTAIMVKTIKPATGNLSRTSQYIGRVEPGQQVAVIPRTAGEVIAIHYNVGDTVQKGALLFEMDTTDIQLAVNVAQAAYDAAALQVEQGLDSGVDAQLLQMEAAYAQAKLGYENALKLADMGEDRMDDQLDSLRDTYTGLNSMIDQQKTILAAKNMELGAVQAELDYYYGGGIDADIQDKQDQIDDLVSPDDDKIAQLNLQIDALVAKKASAASEASIRSEIANIKADIGELSSALGTLQSGYNTASSGYDSIVDGRGLSRAQTNAQIAQAQMAMETAEKALNLAREKSLPQGEATARAGLRQAEASLIQVRRNLEFAQVTAPISGVVELKNVVLHGFATSQSPAYVISNKDMMQVSFAVPEAVLFNLSIGDAVTIERAGQIAVGEITELSTMVSSVGGLFTVKASVPSGAINLLTGTTVTIDVETARTIDGMILPVDCVYYDSNRAYVYINENGFAKKVLVTTGLHNSESIEIVSGISPGDQVISTWHSRLSDGAELSISDGVAG